MCRHVRILRKIGEFKVKSLVIYLCLVIFVLSGCGSNQIQDDLMIYLNESMPALAEQETEAIELYGGVTGANYIDDETLYDTLLNEVLPKYRDFIDNLESIEVETEELSNLHEHYIEAVNLQNSGFIMIVVALEQQDTEKIIEANKNLTESRKILREYQKDLKALAKENDVTIQN